MEKQEVKKIKSLNCLISVWTIILILLSLYLIILSYREYRASIVWEDFYNEMFEMNLNRSSASLMKLFNQSYTSIESNEWKIAQNEDKIVRLENEITNNWNMELFLNWRQKSKMHFYMALITILLAILSWRIDNLKKGNRG